MRKPANTYTHQYRKNKPCRSPTISNHYDLHNSPNKMEIQTINHNSTQQGTRPAPLIIIQPYIISPQNQNPIASRTPSADVAQETDAAHDAPHNDDHAHFAPHACSRDGYASNSPNET
jgi:hypothetical protein